MALFSPKPFFHSGYVMRVFGEIRHPLLLSAQRLQRVFEARGRLKRLNVGAINGK